MTVSACLEHQVVGRALAHEPIGFIFARRFEILGRLSVTAFAPMSSCRSWRHWLGCGGRRVFGGWR